MMNGALPQSMETYGAFAEVSQMEEGQERSERETALYDTIVNGIQEREKNNVIGKQ